MVVHTFWVVPTGGILTGEDGSHREPDGLGVFSVVRIFTARKKGHQADTRDAGAAVVITPLAVLSLLCGKPCEAAVIDCDDFLRHARTESECGILCERGRSNTAPQKDECEEQAKCEADFWNSGAVDNIDSTSSDD